jgi:rhodanese-related sulfurtransferase
LIPTITALELTKREHAGSQLIDVRSASEFAAGHIPGAVNIPMDQIEARLDDLNTHAPLILVCQTGKRAEMTARMLAPCQREIAVLTGGTYAWIAAGLPVVMSVKTRWSLERQVRFGAGLLVLAGVVFARILNPAWIFLSAFAGLGLIFAALTDLCPMAIFLESMPWNQRAHCRRTDSNVEFARGGR